MTWVHRKAGQPNLSGAKPEATVTDPKSNHTVAINIGARNEPILPSKRLTPAELVAVNQILAGGKQELRLNKSGAAVSGYFSLNSLGPAAALTISAGVTAFANNQQNRGFSFPAGITK